MKTNQMQLIFDAKSVNESFARVTIAAFMAELNPTLDEITDVKTAVSEAVTNAIIHGYQSKGGQVFLSGRIEGARLEVTVEDKGIGIADIKKAREPMYTTRPELERSGMGFAFMEAFMEEVEVYSVVGEGTKVIMRKTIGMQE